MVQDRMSGTNSDDGNRMIADTPVGDPGSGIHPERLRRLCQEGVRLTGQHLRTLGVTRRRAILVATALETVKSLTDDAVLMFDRLLGRMSRRVERGEGAALKRDRRTINGKIRLLAKLGDALIAAKASGGDPLVAIEEAVGWEELGREVDEARRLVRSDGIDPVKLATTGFPIPRRIGPSFVAAFTFGAVPACGALARGVAIVRDLHLGHLRKRPADTPVGFIRQGWRRVIGGAALDRRTYQFCVLVELHDRLRAGDMWVRAADATARSSSSSFPVRCSRRCARPDRCPSRLPTRPKNGWPIAATCSRDGWPKSAEKRGWTRLRTSSLRAASCGSRRRRR